MPTSDSGTGQRALRLVTMSVGFQLENSRGLRLEGHSTGLNENGLAGRVNVTTGSLPADPAGTILDVTLDLPKDRGFRPIRGEVLHISPSWVPGFRHFVALKFLEITPEDINYLRRFIAWREADFLAEKPARIWYVFSTSAQQVFGPLTQEELRHSLHAHALSGDDYLWSPSRNQWMLLGATVSLDEDSRWIEKEMEQVRRSPGTTRGAVAFAPQPQAAPVTPVLLMPNPARTAAAIPIPSSPSSTGAAPRRSSLITATFAAFLIVAVLAIAAFFEGTLDFTPAGRLFQAARSDIQRGDSHRALLTLAQLRKVFPAHRLRPQADLLLEQLLREERNAHDATTAANRLALLRQLPGECARMPVVQNAVGDGLFRTGDPRGAMEHFQTVLDNSPNDDLYRYNLGTAALCIGQPRQASELLTSSTAPMNRNPHLYVNAGIAHLMLQQPDQARLMFEMAVSVSRNPEATQRIVDDIYEATES